MHVEQNRAEVALQDLVDHTVQRIVKQQEEVVREAAAGSEEVTLRMEFKWGFDSSSGHSKYNQSVTSNPDEDDQIMLTSLAPIRMTLGDKVVW